MTAEALIVVFFSTSFTGMNLHTTANVAPTKAIYSTVI